MRLTITCAALFFLLACTANDDSGSTMDVKTIDLSGFSSEKPADPLHLLFIHHSCGGQLLADNGEENGDNCIYRTHPNGGGLRQLLEKNNYIVHEASYTSLIGDKTDICHWNQKFKTQMEKILKCNNQDQFFSDDTKNKIVMFKSCYPNNWIEADGIEPGNPDSCGQTTANFKASYRSLLQYFEKQPDTLFVVLTAPPLAEPKTSIKTFLKDVLKRDDAAGKVGVRARSFNNWLKDNENGWLKDYKLKNVVVYDYYDVLTDHGKSNWSMYPTGNGRDSHPSSEGNAKAAKDLAPFINKAVQRMGL